MIVLAYHMITDIIRNELSVTTDNFIKQMEWLKSKHYEFTNLDNIMSSLSSNKKNKQVGIIFDDGYTNTVVDVLPILQRLDIVASMAVSAGFVMRRVKTEIIPHSNKELASCKQIDMWLEAGMQICGHTYSHARLDKIPDNKRQWQIVYDKRQLERLFGIQVINFVYPYGKWNKQCIEIVKKNYMAAFATDNGFYPNLENRYFIKRLEILPQWDIKQFEIEMEREYKNENCNVLA